MNGKRLRGNYVLLRAGSLRLLAPQENMGNIGYLSDKDTAALHCLGDGKQLLAAIDNAGNQQPVFAALSEQLDLTDAIPRNRYVMTTHKKTAEICWCWSEVLLLNGIDVPLTPMPALLRSAANPISAVVTLNDGKQAFVCDFGHLLDYLTRSV